MRREDWIRSGVDHVSFGERLGDLISNANITQAQLEAATGVKQSAISEYINGRSNGSFRAPDCGTVIALAKYFSVSTDYLLGLSDISSIDPNLQSAKQFTGLSEKSVGLLHWFHQLGDENASSIIDALLLDSRFINLDQQKKRSYRSIIDLLYFFFNYSSSSVTKKQVYMNGETRDCDHSRFISDRAIMLDDTIIENAVLMEIQQALMNLKLTQKEEQKEAQKNHGNH